MSSDFVRMFYGRGEDDGDEDIEHEPPPLPPWIGPRDDELGVVVPLGLVVGRSEIGVVALRHATVYAEGVAFAFVALARGLSRKTSTRLLHDQHLFEPDDEASDNFLRVGLELPDGSRVSNLGVRRGRGRFASLDERPTGPVFFEHGGEGGSGGGSRVSVRPSFWLWPLPESGTTIQVFCEWPAVEIPLSSVGFDVGPLVEAKKQVVTLWPSPTG